jgi:Fe2+ or Zn2+ uptake regulation protein
MVGVVKPPTELAEAFRAQGLKVTPQRQLLFGLLDGNTSHPTAEALFVEASAQMPGISLRTVYTTLTDLAEMGELQAVSCGSGAIRFDPNVDDHHHGVCDTCGVITDAYVADADNLVVDGLDGFTTNSASIVFRGQCASCASAAGRSTSIPTPIPNTP